MKALQYKTTTENTGFTLLEILISIMILATVLSTVFASYTGTFRIVDYTQSQARIYEMASTAFERILEDLESVYVPTVSKSAKKNNDEPAYPFEGKDNEVNGQNADSLRFSSWAHLTFAEEDQGRGIAEIVYSVEENSDNTGLVLFRSDTLYGQSSSEQTEQGLTLCEDLASVNFTFVDIEGDEQDNWDPADGIPTMVSVSLEFVNPASPENLLKFTTNIALPVVEEDKKTE